MYPKVSAILPVYNEEKCIRDCLASLLAQDYAALEVIVVDDGSTDSTCSIVKEFIKKDSRVSLLLQKHGGPGKARNFGAQSAKGKILVFPDADEEFPSDYVSGLISPILSGKAIGSTPREVKLNPSSNIFSKIKYLEFARKFGYATNEGSKVFRAILRKEFIRAKGFDTSTDYFDDGSLSDTLGVKPVLTNAYSYTTMSSSPKEIIFDSAWGVRSNIKARNYRPFLFFGGLLVLYAVILWTISQIPLLMLAWYGLFGLVGYKNTGLRASILYYPIFFVSKSIGLLYGVFQAIFFSSKKGR